MPVGNEQPDYEDWQNETYFAVKNMNRLKQRQPKLAPVQVLIRQWIEQFQYCILVRDYGQAEKMFDPHVIAFDRKETFVCGVKDLRTVWEKQWPVCDRFEFDLSNLKGLVGTPYLTVCTVWQAAFGNGKGARGRVTFVFVPGPALVINKDDPKVDRLLCVHSHMSEVD